MTSWLKYDYEIKKIMIYVNIIYIYFFFYFNSCLFYDNFMLIYVNITDRRTDKHIKSIVRNLSKYLINLYFVR